MPIPLIPAKVYPIILLLKMIIEDNSSVPRNKRCAPLTISTTGIRCRLQDIETFTVVATT